MLVNNKLKNTNGVNCESEANRITYDEFLNDRLKPLYSKKKQCKNVEQLYSRVEYELRNYLNINNIQKGSKEEKKLIILLKASISDVRSSDTISMGGLILTMFGIFAALLSDIIGKEWVIIIYSGFCFAGTYFIKEAEKWFGYAGKKNMVLNICLNLLVDK
ncbi:hypothetical protein [Ruminiclostridium herbifermentans]|nr:hypothetical protein [Ruminiclostridium herbifermentans]